MKMSLYKLSSHIHALHLTPQASTKSTHGPTTTLKHPCETHPQHLPYKPLDNHPANTWPNLTFPSPYRPKAPQQSNNHHRHPSPSHPSILSSRTSYQSCTANQQARQTRQAMEGEAELARYVERSKHPLTDASTVLQDHSDRQRASEPGPRS